MSLSLKNESPKKRNSKLYKQQLPLEASLNNKLSEKNQEINRLKLLLQQQNQSLEVYKTIAKTLVKNNNLNGFIRQRDKEETILSHLITANLMLEHTISSLHKRQVNTYYLSSIIDKLKLIKQQYLPATASIQKPIKENQWQDNLVENIKQLDQSTKHTDFKIEMDKNLSKIETYQALAVNVIIQEIIKIWTSTYRPFCIKIEVSSCNNQLLLQLNCLAEFEKTTVIQIKRKLNCVKKIVEATEGSFLIETKKHKEIVVNILI